MSKSFLAEARSRLRLVLCLLVAPRLLGRNQAHLRRESAPTPSGRTAESSLHSAPAMPRAPRCGAFRYFLFPGPYGSFKFSMFNRRRKCGAR
jgi:hypothetical protein